MTIGGTVKVCKKSIPDILGILISKKSKGFYHFEIDQYLFNLYGINLILIGKEGIIGGGFKFKFKSKFKSNSGRGPRNAGNVTG